MPIASDDHDRHLLCMGHSLEFPVSRKKRSLEATKCDWNWNRRHGASPGGATTEVGKVLSEAWLVNAQTDG